MIVLILPVFGERYLPGNAGALMDFFIKSPLRQLAAAIYIPSPDVAPEGRITNCGYVEKEL